MYFAIVENNAITAYGRPRDLWPDVSFPATGPNAEFLQENNALPVSSTPTYDPVTQDLQVVEPYLQAGIVYNRQAVDRPVPPPVPQWVAFGTALVPDPGVNALVAAAAANAPVLHGMLIVGLGQAAQGDPQTFGAAWSAARAAGLVSPELIANMQATAAVFNLPAEFIAGLEN